MMRQARRLQQPGMPKAVIFDVDGTLVDTNELHVAAWREVFLRYGRDVNPERLRAQMGKGGDQLMPVFWSKAELARFGAEMQAQRVEIFMRDYLRLARPFPGVRPLFERIRRDGVRIALASSAKAPELRHHLESLGVGDLVDATTSADDAEHSKPWPDIFQAALARLAGIAPADAIVVGDSPFDVQAAARAGMRCIGVLSGGFAQGELEAAGAVAVYPDVAQLGRRYDESPLAREGAWT
jgi:HAD superfamily hydrolase (TIGR01509 family)